MSVDESAGAAIDRIHGECRRRAGAVRHHPGPGAQLRALNARWDERGPFVVRGLEAKRHPTAISAG